MSSILHRVVIECSRTELYQALTTSEGLSAWWTQASSDNRVGGKAIFGFGPNGEHKAIMQITDLQKDTLVAWDCTEGPWQSTEAFVFKIKEDARGCALEFENSGWHETGEFFMHCNCKWGLFLGLSLKSYLETGKGVAHPNEPNI